MKIINRNPGILLCTAFCIFCVTTIPTAAQPTLKQTFENDFLIGATLNRLSIMGKKPATMDLVGKQFNDVSPENVLKWSEIHPKRGTYRFEAGDRYVKFGQKHDMWIHGHTLIWHHQTPDWVFEQQDGSPVDRQTLLRRMKEHIQAVAGRYKGKIDSWDVVNEAVTSDGSLRNSKWETIIGDDYIAKAFKYAREAAPHAELYYNDYDLWKPAKRKGVIQLIKRLQANGVPIDGLGMQMHVNLGINHPHVNWVEASIQAFSKLGIKLAISELDVDVLPRPPENTDVADPSDSKWNPYPNGLPENIQQQLAERYASLFQLFVKYRNSISRVTFWGVSNSNSWRNHSPIGPRVNYPLLFDRHYNPTLAFKAVIKAGNDTR